MRQLTQHHRRCKINNGSDDNGNIAMVTDRKHKAWHTVFGTKTADKIVWELNNVWLDPAVTVILVEKEKPIPNQLKLGL